MLFSFVRLIYHFVTLSFHTAKGWSYSAVVFLLTAVLGFVEEFAYADASLILSIFCGYQAYQSTCFQIRIFKIYRENKQANRMAEWRASQRK